MSVPETKYQRHVSDDIKQIVGDFYLEDISRILAGMKDIKSVKEGSKRVKKTKRTSIGQFKRTV